MSGWLSGHKLFTDLETIQAEVSRLGVPIRFAAGVEASLSPLTVAGRPIGNRFVLQPMEGCDGTVDGRPGELTFRRWQRLGAGGAKILWGEAMAVVPEGRANPRQLVIGPDTAREVGRLVDVARTAHQDAWGSSGDFLVGVQLTHSGRYSSPPVHGMDDDDLAGLIDAYLDAARVAERAGADFVDVKHCHGYLLNELLATRNGAGRYRGTLENRTRLGRAIITRIRAEVPGIFVAVRLNIFDGVPHGAASGAAPGFGCDRDEPSKPDLSEPLQVVGDLARAGVELLNVTAGCPYTNPHIGRPADRPPSDGYAAPEPGLAGVARHFELAAAVQRAYPDLPVVGTGYSYLRQFFVGAGEANLQDGAVSLVGVGRGAIAYPDFVADLHASGGLDPRKVCLTVSQCTTLMRSKHNELGQYEAGCVPRDPVYARILQEARRAARTAG